MPHVVLVQLPVPQLNFGRQTGNIPLGAACLKQAVPTGTGVKIDIIAQRLTTYLGDAALLNIIIHQKPDVIGFTTYLWNVQRTITMACAIKKHYTPQIVLGGPEVTPDNMLLHNEAIDVCVYGEGEQQFAAWLQNYYGCKLLDDDGSHYRCFEDMPSPYLHFALDHELENTMLLETMRGCPYSCAFCYYNKSHKKLSFKADPIVMAGIRWALEHDISELYLLDPSLNSRPNLKALLKQIATLNRNHRLSLISEIRAEAVDDELADLFLAAGFTWFEIGLQSINAKALTYMHRRTNLDRFLKGAKALEKRQIATAVDLIVGLPGDDLQGFDRSVQFVGDNKLYNDVQVFPLSILPGTEFRQRHQELKLAFENNPPYTIISTPTFSQEEISLAFDHAESRFDLSIYPLPDLDVAWQTDVPTGIETASHIEVNIAQEKFIYKVLLNNHQTLDQWSVLAHRVTHPYQLIMPPSTDNFRKISEALSVFTQINPHTPVELIFFAPKTLPCVKTLLKAARLHRPHYLDGDLRLFYDQPGNRAILFTVVTSSLIERFSGPMQRHIHWWQSPELPTIEEIGNMEMEGFDGVLVDAPVHKDCLTQWQDKMAPHADEMILIGFAHTDLHRRWLLKTASEDYCFQLLP